MTCFQLIAGLQVQGFGSLDLNVEMNIEPTMNPE